MKKEFVVIVKLLLATGLLLALCSCNELATKSSSKGISVNMNASKF